MSATDAVTVEETRGAQAPALRRAGADATALIALRMPRRRFVLVAGLVTAIGVALIATTVGSVAIPLPTVFRVLLSHLPGLQVTADWPASHDAVIWQIRLPRVVLAGLVGAALSISGATYQGLLRNPLADPYLIGTAGGAALGAVLAIVAPLPAILYRFGLVQAAAFLAAVLAVAVVYGFARVGKTTPVTTLLLAGVALGALTSAITSFLMYAHGDKLPAIYAWLLGGFALSNWQQVVLTVPCVALGIAVIWLYARPLNVLQLGDDQAAQLGLDVERLKLLLVGAATLVTAAAVAVSGLIAFVGLIVPHMVRLLWGPDFRFLLPMSALGGAVFLILADALARVILAPAEVPVGVITAFCGAPFFLYLLRTRKRMVF